MDDFASNFQIKFKKIISAEKLTSKKLGVLTSDTFYDYKEGRSGPSAKNLAKIIVAYPKYTYYLLDLPNNNLPSQVFL